MLFLVTFFIAKNTSTCDAPFLVLQLSNRATILRLALSTRQITPLRSIEKPKRIAVRTKVSIHVIRVDEIIRCLADNNYCTIYYGAGIKIMVAKTLKSVGEILPSNEFVRVHQSHIVRVNAIHLVFQDHIMLYNGNSIPLSRQCRKELMNRLEDMVTYL